MAQLSELKRRKGMTLLVLSLVLLMSTAMTVISINAVPVYLEPDGWTDPAIMVQDTANTPGRGGGPVDPWYDDCSGPGQIQRELLYIYIDWDDTYVYVRWDFAALPEEMTSVYYVIKTDFDNLTAPEDQLDDTRGTHALGIEVDGGTVNATIRTYGQPKFDLVWMGDDTDWTINSLPVAPGDPYASRTAIEGRFPWAELTESGDPEDFLVITAQSHSNQGDQGWTSAIKDYIGVNDNPVPWFTDLGLTLLATAVLAGVIKRKKRVLPVNVGSGL